MSELAILGGPKAIQRDPEDAFTKVPPAVMEKMDEAVLNVLHNWKMSGSDITKEFEQGYADWHGMKYALGFNNGTAALLASMYAAGVGHGDEIICPSLTYWASTLQVFALGGTVVFADIDPESLCIDPKDIEKKITDRTKAIMVVHYAGVPADMDAIMEIAEKHDIKVIEDVSHAHGALYKGKMVGTIGHVSAFSLMSGKSFGIGEGGILLTNDQEIYERSMILGLYARHRDLEFDYLRKGAGLPWGGYKHRMHQMSSALGLVTLDYFPEQIKEIDKAMNYFWDLLEDVPGIAAHRPAKDSGSTKGGWYFPLGHYKPEELGGLSVTRFCQALQEEGVPSSPGCNKALHTHPLLTEIDVYNHGKPTRLANAQHDVIKLDGELPVSEGLQARTFTIPLFYTLKPEIIEEYANAFKKVAANYKELLVDDPGNPKELGMHFRF